ncbi:MAG TPA: winged helix-turn-helix domain-containing protein [Pyrinomonadaceae bacterium]|nr:winged helix-turn-helix domain-containing protein [Pyrinomonadaceae bacterium]
MKTRDSVTIYEFGDFRLDTREKTLSLNGSDVHLTPKSFELLKTFVESPGTLIEKDVLIGRLWPDSFVEESNLTFHIRLVRKALDDQATDPRFIETVPKRGYRFIAPVVEVNKNGTTIGRPVQPEVPPASLHLSWLALFSTAIAVILVFGLGLAWLKSRETETTSALVSAPLFETPLSVESLSTTGGVHYAVISPEGKHIVYLTTEGKVATVWLRNAETGASKQIIPATTDLYYGFAISPDSESLYFGRRPRNHKGQADIYRIPLYGGTPEKLVSEAQGWISLSPDGGKISFVRCQYGEEEFCSLWVANADGGDERMVASRPRPFRIAVNAFSPDGRTLGFASGQSANQSNEFGIYGIDLATGAERELSSERFFNVKGLAWLPDGREMLISAAKVPARRFTLWRLSPTGEAVQIQSVVDDISQLSIDRTASRLTATVIKPDFKLRLVGLESGSPETLTSALNASFAPNGKIVFSSARSGMDAIWSMNIDGSEQRQLTSANAWESRPIVSPDGRTVYFASNRSGAVHVWQMASDGSDQIQLSRENGGFPLSVDASGDWVYYHHAISRDLWRISLRDGSEQRVFSEPANGFSISPDRKLLAFAGRNGNRDRLTIASIENGETIVEFGLPETGRILVNAAWMPDGNSLLIVSCDLEYENSLLWRCSADGKQCDRLIDLGDEELSESSGISISADGKTAAYVQGEWKHDAVLFNGLR